MVELGKYIDDLQAAIVSNPYLTNRDRESWYATLRDIGYGLRDYDRDSVNDILGTLYGRLFVLPHVKHGRRLPDIDARDMINQIKVKLD